MDGAAGWSWTKAVVWAARIGCILSVAGFFAYLALRSVSISGARGEVQLYIIHLYLRFAVAALISSILLLVTVVARSVAGPSRRVVLLADGLLCVISVIFAGGLWIFWRL